MSEDKNIIRIWKPIEFNEKWANADTSVLDDLSASWFSRRKVLKENPEAYINFLEELKREHAIETGVIERLYDIKKGVTETLIKKGFVQSYLSHGDTNIDKDDLFNHLNDHLDAVNFIFDIIKDDHRPFGTSFIKELHQLTTRHQKHAEGRDQFGTKLKIPLLKGQFKKRENNPTASDGTVIMYCPPEHVDAEMERLVEIYQELITKEIHPLIIATWLHHAFVTIHPFQDGNGRVARLLTSMVFIKNNLFPFTVLREDAKVKYIDALEEADGGEIQRLVDYFASVQKRNIENALTVDVVSNVSLEKVQNIFAEKLSKWKKENKELNEMVLMNEIDVFNYCLQVLEEQKEDLKEKVNGDAKIQLSKLSFEDNISGEHISYIGLYKRLFGKRSRSLKLKTPLNTSLPWIGLGIELSASKKYLIFISFRHFGSYKTALEIRNKLLVGDISGADNFESRSLKLNPHIFSLEENISNKKKNIKQYLEEVLTRALAKIASEL